MDDPLWRWGQQDGHRAGPVEARQRRKACADYGSHWSAGAQRPGLPSVTSAKSEDGERNYSLKAW